jgi:hypothetical protein
VLLHGSGAAPASALLVRPAGPGDRRRIRALYDGLEVRLSTRDVRCLTHDAPVVAVLDGAGERLLALVRLDTGEVTVAAGRRIPGVEAAVREVLGRHRGRRRAR